ncbi:MAG: phosphate ABC transporter permease PstA, partial [Burkholderiales bacterium]
MKALIRSGEPFIWLTGGALAFALLMVAGLIGIIVTNAVGFFWPAGVVRVTLADGKVLTGQVADRERVPGTSA